jgi:hypothetical protein
VKRKSNKGDRKTNAANMARLRKVRRKLGYTEVLVWIPVEEKERLRLWAQSARSRCQREFVAYRDIGSADA